MAILSLFGFCYNVACRKLAKMISKISANTVKPIYFAQNDTIRNNKLSFKDKAIILGSSALGVGLVTAGLAKHKGFSLNPIKIAKTPIKDWAIFKYKKGTNAIDFEEPEIIAVATGSVAGGYAGGVIVDPQNTKAKKREVLNQILGNVLVPVGCVGLSSRIFEKYSDKIIQMMPQINKETKFAKVFNQISKNLPNVAATLIALGIGIVAGNRVSNLINEKLYHKKVERDIKPSDFAPHVDDLCLATSLMNKEAEFGSKIARVIPLALMVPGYETGTAQE